MNSINKYLFLVVIVSCLTSCIEFFHPDLGSTPAPKYVVDGQITDQEGYQTVSLSTTSTFDLPNINTLSNCDVKIIDNLGNEFKLEEFKWGQYHVWMKQEDLKPGNSYQLKILTNSGIEIVSEFDQMPMCPDVDSIYYLRKDYPTTNPAETAEGIQFYIDVDKKNTNSQYFRWEIDETWEHHSVYPITSYWNKWEIVTLLKPDYSRFICWTTEKMKKIFTLSTENFTQKVFRMNPIHIVDNQTQKLTYCYSALISQFAISEPAFRYWDKLRLNSSEQGGLYSGQPLRIKGNLICTTNPELEVLGFFGASSVKSKRVFVQNVENFNVLKPSCVPPRAIDPRFDLKRDKMQYLIKTDKEMKIIENGCVECDYLNGTTVKPSYWPYTFEIEYW